MHRIDYLGIDENKEYEEIISKALEQCFKIEGLPEDKLIVGITLTNPENIKELNKKYRNIDSTTDVLSFPMYEKEEIQQMIKENIWEHEDILGDMVISIEQVEKQAKEYGNGIKRELSYMVVHSFYHLLGYDHMEEEDKKKMREKEEEALQCIDFLAVAF